MEKEAAVAALGALAQETRLEVFRMLVEAGPEGLPVGTIGKRLELPSPTLSFHLTQLRVAGLIGFRREGRSLIYSVRFEGMNALMAFLSENCCGGNGSCPAAPSCEPAALRRSAQRTEV